MTQRYRCFHCEEVFVGRKAAYEHFGDETPCGHDVPACVDPLRGDEKAMFRELRTARTEALKGMRQEERADELEWDLRQVTVALRKHFGDDCTTLWQAADRYGNLQFENKMLRSEIEQLKRRLQMEQEGITAQDIAETMPERVS